MGRGGLRPPLAATGLGALVLTWIAPLPIAAPRLMEEELFWLLLFVVVALSLAWSVGRLTAGLERAVAERARAEAGARARDRLLATVSHELRTPLAVTLSWIQLLRSRRVSGNQVDRALETIERNTILQARLVAELLDLSRKQGGAFRLERRLVALPAVVRQVVESLGPVAAAAGVRLDSALDAPALHVVGDVLRLQQIFSNLIVNAVKFTPAGGTVSVQFDRRPTAVRVSVTDTGVGIEPDLLPYVFEPFRRSERAHGADGLGLGLAIVRDLVELHGGVVQASSAGSGRGASFVVELPLAGSEPERRHAPVSASS